MSVPSYIGRFWPCPECKRHTPVCRNACICGFDRTTAQVQIREVTVPAPRGGIAVATTRDSTGAYVSARAEAQAFEESPGVAGIRPGWVRTTWGGFPEPENTASGYNPGAVAARWDCGNVTGWGH